MNARKLTRAEDARIAAIVDGVASGTSQSMKRDGINPDDNVNNGVWNHRFHRIMDLRVAKMGLRSLRVAPDA